LAQGKHITGYVHIQPQRKGLKRVVEPGRGGTFTFAPLLLWLTDEVDSFPEKEKSLSKKGCFLPDKAKKSAANMLLT
jgi:hypothetical protein